MGYLVPADPGQAVRREYHRAGAIMFSWMLVGGPILVLGGRYLGDVPGALIGAGILFPVYFWRYAIYIMKMKLVWEEEEITRERTRREVA